MCFNGIAQSRRLATGFSIAQTDQRYTSYDGSLVFMSGWTGIDFRQYAPTDLVKKVETNAIISAIEHLAGGAKSWTIDELAAWGGIGGMGPVFVGSPSTVADILQSWVV